MKRTLLLAVFGVLTLFSGAHSAHADALTLTSGNNATTTPSVATSITGFQIVGPSASTTPVKIHVTSGTVHVSTVSGVTMTGNDTATLNLSGTVANLNTALSSLTYTRASTGTDTLEVALVNTDQIYFPTNGHVYQYVSSSLTWNAAKTAAEALSAYGVPGYLVTITSSTENDFVKARLSGDAWIGASDASGEGDWKWVTGPEAGTSFWLGAAGGHTVGGQYASWNGGEPNDSGGNEDCGEEYVANGTWNDLPCSGITVSGYVAEFGTDLNPPVVVSKNVSIVTADVPAVTSIFPATGAVNATTTANFAISFSKTVTADTGNILIKKSSDDSTVETIAVGSGLVTGGGTSVIIINPATTLEEGVQYYVLVPGTAFKDGSNNHFDGILATTTWTFTTADLTAPQITLATSTIATTTATVAWSTNELSSSRAWYGVTTALSSSTPLADTSPRVTSHSAAITSLVACTLYNYRVVSSDASGNIATSSAATFTTTGCPGSTTPSSATSSAVTVSASSTVTHTDSGRTLTVDTPANFTATSSSVVIQIKAQDATPVLDTLGMPSTSLYSGAEIVFEVTALINNTTTLDSFNSPVTITYTYTDEDITGLDESSLRMYHYHGGSWVALDNCSVNQTLNTISCSTPSFSTFAIFGSLTAPASGSSSTGSIKEQVRNLERMGKSTEAEALKDKWYWLFPKQAVASSTPSVRDLKLGMSGDDVLALQKLLNGAGFTLTTKGSGASGNESTYFGSRTKKALIAYQKKHGVVPASGYFGSITRAKMKSVGTKGVWW